MRTDVSGFSTHLPDVIIMWEYSDSRELVPWKLGPPQKPISLPFFGKFALGYRLQFTSQMIRGKEPSFISMC